MADAQAMLKQALAPEKLSLDRRLLEDIGNCRVDRPRRTRVYPRKVRIKMRSSGLKHSTARERVNVDAEIYLIELS